MSQVVDDESIARSPSAIGWHPAVRIHELALTAVSIATFFVLWQIVSVYAASEVLFPGPIATLKALVELADDGVLLVDVRVSLLRIALGFVLGVAVGVPLGLAMGTFPLVRIICEPYVQFFRFVPAIAWLIPAILWFGIGESSKIFLIFYTTLFLVLLNTMEGVSSVRPNQIRAAQCFGATALQRYAWVILPGTMPYILTGMRLAMGNSFAAVVGAELIAAERGIGFLIVDSWMWMAAPRMFAGMLTLGILGVFFDFLFQATVRLCARRYLIEG